MLRKTIFMQEKEIPMPRKLRMYLLGIPSHVVQRGNDRNPCFFEEENYWFFLNLLSKTAGSRFAFPAYAV
jgi:hypothetical protein